MMIQLGYRRQPQDRRNAVATAWFSIATGSRIAAPVERACRPFWVLFYQCIAALPALWPYLDWVLAGIDMALVFIIRSLVGLLSLQGTSLGGRERLVVAFYDVRGIGSVYYLAYADSHIELLNEEQLWAAVALTVLLSTVVHSLTAGIAVERATGGQ